MTGTPSTEPTGPTAPTQPTAPTRQTGGYTGGELLALASAVLVRPDLWWTALGELRRLAPRLWWRNAPHLPLPDRRLWEFRMVTAYGRPDAVPGRSDVVSFLEWCRATGTPPATRSGGRG